MDDTAHQGLRDLDPVSFLQSNPMQGVQGFTLNQGLQYDGQHRAPSKDGPIPEPDDFGATAPSLHSKYGLTGGVASNSHLDTCSTNYFTAYTEPTAGPHPDTGSANYFPAYTKPAAGPHPVTGSANYFTAYTEPGGAFTAEASDMRSNTGFAAGTVNYIYHPDPL